MILDPTTQKFFKGKALAYLRRRGLQVRGDGPARGYHDADHSPRGPGRLQLGRAAEFLGDRAILSAAGNQTEIAVSRMDTVEAVRKLVAMGGWIWTSCLRKRNRKTSSRLNCPCDCRRA